MDAGSLSRMMVGGYQVCVYTLACPFAQSLVLHTYLHAPIVRVTPTPIFTTGISCTHSHSFHAYLPSPKCTHVHTLGCLSPRVSVTKYHRLGG